jgi:hypothetical protein
MTTSQELYQSILEATDRASLFATAEKLHHFLRDGGKRPVVCPVEFAAKETPYSVPRAIYIRPESGKRWSYTIAAEKVAHIAETRVVMHVWDESDNGSLHCTFTFNSGARW